MTYHKARRLPIVTYERKRWYFDNRLSQIRKKIHLVGYSTPKNRKVKVTLSNGTVVTIESCYESWQQYGGNERELYLTMPIAEQYNDWLHGGELVR